MQLSFNELVVLTVAANEPLNRTALAEASAALFPSTKYDAKIALTDIRTLEERKFLAKRKSLAKGEGVTLDVTREGMSALERGSEVLQDLQRALCRVTYGAGSYR